MKIFYRIFFAAWIVVFISASAANAQRFNAGITAGALASDLVGLDSYDTDYNKAGFTFGGFVNTHIGDKKLLQFEIYYIQKGSLQPADSTNNYVYYKLNLDYV